MLIGAAACIAVGETIGIWAFDESSGQAIFDSSPHQLDGFLGMHPDPDGMDPARIAGLDGSPGALRMDGAGFAQIQHASRLQPVGSFTIRAIIRPSVEEQYGRIVCNLERLNENVYSGYDLDLQQDSLRFALFGPEGREYYLIAAFDFHAGEIYWLAASWNAQAQIMDVFVNDVRISVTGNIVGGSRFTHLPRVGPNRGNLFIGATSFGPSEMFFGDIDDVWLTDEPLMKTGDLNCDGAVDFGDINPFILALTNGASYSQQYPDCGRGFADINGDGYIDLGDINPFVNLLVNP